MHKSAGVFHNQVIIIGCFNQPGGFMHNARYLIQLMYDTMENLSEVATFDISNLNRPE